MAEATATLVLQSACRGALVRGENAPRLTAKTTSIDPSFFPRSITGRVLLPDFFGNCNPNLPPFTAEGDADMLKALIDGNKDHDIMEVLTGRSPAEIQQARAVFESTFGITLMDAVKRVSSSNFEEMLVACVRSPVEFDVWQLHDAISGVGTTDNILIEVLSTRTNAEIRAIKALYLQEHGKELVDAIEGDTSFGYENLLVKLCEGDRDEEGSGAVNIISAQQDAASIRRAGEEVMGTEDDVFVKIFSKRSASHLRAMEAHYATLGKKSLEEAIRSETSGSYADLLCALLNPPKYMAQLLHDGMKGIGTNDERLIRLLVRTKCDPQRTYAAKHLYRRMYDTPLIKAIESEESGDVKQGLRRLGATNPGEYWAVRLREAMKGLGTDEDEITRVLAVGCRTTEERESTARAYELDYGETLADAVISESSVLSSGWRDCVVALASSRAAFDAKMLKRAMDGIGTTESVLIETLTSRTNDEIQAIKAEFEKLTGKNLEKRVESETRSSFENILLALLSAMRSEKASLLPGEAKEIAERLWQKGENKWGTDDDVFIEMFTKYSSSQLQQIDVEYAKMHGHGLEKAIEKETSGDYATTLAACLNPTKYTAECIRASIKGIGTSEWKLTRCLVHRSTKERQEIKRAFQELTGASVEDWIKGDTSGNYEEILLMLLRDTGDLQTSANRSS